MDKWILEPLKSIGQIKFRMNRNELHKMLHRKYTVFKKSRFSENTTDDYGDFHVFYSKDDKVKAVEIFDNIEVLYKTNIIFPIKENNIANNIPGIKREGNSFIQKDYSIGIETNGQYAESILVGEENYYK